MAVLPAGLRTAGAIPTSGGAVPGAEDKSGDNKANKNGKE